jgi:hypothetical protein
MLYKLICFQQQLERQITYTPHQRDRPKVISNSFFVSTAKWSYIHNKEALHMEKLTCHILSLNPWYDTSNYLLLIIFPTQVQCHWNYPLLKNWNTEFCHHVWVMTLLHYYTETQLILIAHLLFQTIGHYYTQYQPDKHKEIRDYFRQFG